MLSCLLLLSMLSQVITDTRTESAPWRASRVDLCGVGCNGTDPTGPIVQFRDTDGFILGAGDPFRGTGSRLERLRIVTTGGGGTALRFVVTSPGDRAGEIVLNDVKIMGTSDLSGGTVATNWDRGLVCEGIAADLRTVSVRHLRVAGCLSESILLRNVTHFRASDVEVSIGSSPRPKPIVIVDSCEDVQFSQASIYGEVHFRNSRTVIFDGYAQAVYVDAKCKNIVIRGVVDVLSVEEGARGRCDAIVAAPNNRAFKTFLRW